MILDHVVDPIVREALQNEDVGDLSDDELAMVFKVSVEALRADALNEAVDWTTFDARRHELNDAWQHIRQFWNV